MKEQGKAEECAKRCRPIDEDHQNGNAEEADELDSHVEAFHGRCRGIDTQERLLHRFIQRATKSSTFATGSSKPSPCAIFITSPGTRAHSGSKAGGVKKSRGGPS